VAVAIELRRWFVQGRRAAANCLLVQRRRRSHVEIEHRRECLVGTASLTDHDVRVADDHFGVSDRAVGTAHHELLLPAQSARDEVDERGGVLRTRYGVTV
jgi:hypothetical protein